MKKFNFSLQKVLEIKEQVLESLKIELGILNNDLFNIDESIKNFKKQFSDINNEFVLKSSISVSVGEMTYYKMLMNSILKQIESKEEEEHVVFKKIESKRQEIVNMNMEISSIEKLKEKELEKYNKAVLKSEEIFIEEFVSNKSLTKEIAI
ncbi:MAG: flagellar export protein FliJ [Sedimentibacter sp.]